VTGSVPSADDFFDHTTTALESVAQPSPRDGRAARMRVAGFVLLGLGLLAVIVGAVLFAQADRLGLEEVLGIGVGGGLLVAAVGLALVLAARSRRRRSAIERSERYRDEVEGSLADVVAADLATPAGAVLADHRAVREAALGTSPG